MDLFRNLCVGIAIVVVLIIWTLTYLFDLPEGWPRNSALGGSVLLFGLIIYLGNRSQSRPTPKP
jgi:hypothetical protein